MLSRRTAILYMLAPLVLGLGACGDEGPSDPVTPSIAESVWSELALPAGHESGELRAVASRDGRTLFLLLSGEGRPSLVEDRGEDLRFTRLDSGFEPLDLAFDSNHRATLVGYVHESAGPRPAILVDDGNWNRVVLEPVWGGLQTVAVSGDDRFLAAGVAPGMVLAYEGSIEGAWNRTAIPVGGGRGEDLRSIVDLDHSEGVWAGCGFDEGYNQDPLHPFQILLLKSDDEWMPIETPCGVCLAYDFRTVVLDPHGGILLGGRRVNGEGLQEAFLWRFDLGRMEWQEYDLPHPELLFRVNDLECLDNGELLLACGNLDPEFGADAAYLVRIDPTGESAIEWAKKGAFLRQLAQAPRGVLAVGYRWIDGSRSPLLLRYGPPSD